MNRIYGDYEFDIHGICLATGTKYDCDGFDVAGFNENGIALDGRDLWLYDKDGIGPCGFYKNGIHSVTAQSILPGQQIRF